MSLRARFDEHIRLFTVFTVVGIGFTVGNYLKSDFEQHPVRDGALLAAFAYTTYRAARQLNTSTGELAEMQVFGHTPSPAQQMHYNAGLMYNIAPLPAALGLQLATLPNTNGNPFVYLGAGLLGAAAVGTYAFSRKCTREANAMANA